MLRDFDEVKRQLVELAQVINAFKSEAVQLRLVEFLLGGTHHSASGQDPRDPAREKQVRKKAQRRPRARRGAEENPPAAKRKPAAGKAGPLATLTSLLDQGYFRTPQTIGAIVEHCGTKLALQFKQSDLSGKLIRLVRDGKLERAKNAEGQFEYKQA